MANRGAAIKHLLLRNTEEIIDHPHLERVLLSGKKLRVKHGVDPTGDKIHLGRAISLWKLREFQDLGHKIVLIIGDFTAQIGDPSDKLEKRPFIAKIQIERNMKNYLPQIGKILDLKKAEIRYNSEWLSRLNFRDVSDLAELFSVAQILERRNFQERWKKNKEISLRELMYPLMQGYDSVAVKADVEIGGSDQLFNLIAGRKIQERYGQEPQDIMTTKMLLGLDGRKMSTSWGNVVNTSDSPDEQFGKIMSMHDSEILNYFELTTDAGEEKIRTHKQTLTAGKNPKPIKEDLAGEIVRRYHGTEAAEKARSKFEKLFSKKEVPEELPEIKSKKKVAAIDLIASLDFIKSRSEARRLIEQGGLEVSGMAKKDPKEIINFHGGEVLRVGKKRFFRVKV
ncbi:MAG: tyrosine--tRNA ligase [Patescibacteria group bacterium]